MYGPRGGEGRGRPNEAMLQLALLPSITGFGSTQALLADSGSRKVTYSLGNLMNTLAASRIHIAYRKQIQKTIK